MATAAKAKGKAKDDVPKEPTETTPLNAPKSDDPDFEEEAWMKLNKLFTSQWFPITAGLLFEVLFCLVFTQWARVGKNASEAEDVRVFDLRITYWVTLISFILLRVAVVSVWRSGKGRECIWAGLYTLFSTLPFVVYIALYYWMVERLTFVSMSEQPQVDYAADPSTPGLYTESCMEPYVDGPSCDGRAMVGGVDCCVIAKGVLKTVTGQVPILHTTVSGTFQLFKWATVITMSWLLIDVPLIKLGAHSKDFVSGAWIDILDCIMFGDYILWPTVQNPDYGLVRSGPDEGRLCTTALERECWGSLHKSVWAVWLISFVTALVTPAIFLILKFLDKDEAQKRSIDDAMGDLTNHIKMLNPAKAEANLQECIDLQMTAYEKANDDGDAHPVVVKAEQRPGIAVPDGCGKYRVTYSDKTSEVVDVGDLEPDWNHNVEPWFGTGCCHGWFRAGFLCPKSDKHKFDAFERRAAWLNALRGLLLLELPFLCYRFYFDVLIMHWPGVMLLKNFVFVAIQLGTVIACGNDSATICSSTPIKTMNSLLKGTKLTKIIIMPSTLMRAAIEIYDNGKKAEIARKTDILQHQKAWLLVERHHWQEDPSQPAVHEYTSAITEAQKQIDVNDAETAAMHV